MAEQTARREEGGVAVVGRPCVWLVGRQQVDRDALDGFLAAHGVSWETDTEAGAEVLTEAAGRVCYMSFARPRPGGNRAYEERLLSSYHGSVLEHAVWNLVAAGISRNCTHELVRHRAGWGYSQLSTRYVDAADFGFVLDDLIGEDAECRAAWLKAVGAAQDAYKLIDGRLQDKLRQALLDGEGRLRAGQRWTFHADCGADVTGTVAEVTEAGYVVEPDGERSTRHPDGRYRFGFGDRAAAPPDVRTALQKKAREAARQVLPGCLETKIFMTVNARAFRHFVEMRAAEGAAWEIRRLANAMWDAVAPEAPALFGDYERKDLPDGTYTLTPKWRKV